MITKLISSQTVISKVIADLDITENNLRISDMLEWIGEAINKIGGISQMQHKVETLPIRCNQVALPCDLHKVIQVAYSFNTNQQWLPTRYTTSTFKVQPESCNENRDPRFIHEDVLVEVYRTMHRRDMLTREEALKELNANSELRSVLIRLINTRDFRFGASGTDFSWDIQYYIKPGYLVCSQRDGFVKIAYNAMPRDEDGYPLVPDEEGYIEAIYWYIVMKLQYPMYVSGRIPQHVYYDTRHSWNFYCKQAYGNLKMPNMDELKSIQNSWLRLYPVLDEHDTFYSTVGQEQLIHNRN